MKRPLCFIGAVVLTMLGWAVAWHVDPIIRTYIHDLPYDSVRYNILVDLFGTYRAEIVSLGIVWLLGGCVTAFALRLTNSRVNWSHMFLIALSWLLGGFIWIWFFLKGTNIRFYWNGYYTLHLAGFIGGVTIALVVTHVQPTTKWWQAALIAVGWVLGRFIVGEETIQWALRTVLQGRFTPAVFGALFGGIGSAIMAVILYSIQWGMEESPILSDLSILLRPPNHITRYFIKTRKSYVAIIWIGLLGAFWMATIALLGAQLQPGSLQPNPFGRIGQAALLAIIIVFSGVFLYMALTVTTMHLNQDLMQILCLTKLPFEDVMLAMIQVSLAQFRSLLILYMGLLIVSLPLVFWNLYSYIIYVPEYLKALSIIEQSIGVVGGACGLNLLAVVLGTYVGIRWGKSKTSLILAVSSMLLISVLLAGIILVRPHVTFMGLQETAAACIFALIPYALANIVLRNGILWARQRSEPGQLRPWTLS